MQFGVLQNWHVTCVRLYIYFKFSHTSLGARGGAVG